MSMGRFVFNLPRAVCLRACLEAVLLVKKTGVQTLCFARVHGQLSNTLREEEPDAEIIL